MVLGLFGCKNFEAQKLSSEEVLQQKLEHFKWDEVDTYPIFDSCKNLIEKKALKTCFENTLATHFHDSFLQLRVISPDSINETLLLFLNISKKGEPSIDSMKISAKVQQEFPEIKTWFRQSLDSLPKIDPATKRGIPVATKFILPIKIVSK